MTSITPASSKVVTEIEQFLTSFRNPQSDLDLATNLVTAFGAVGILQASMPGWLQGVLVVVGGVLVAIGQRPVTATLARRAARRAAGRK
ncbi:MAG TPA: hypothetical protein VFX16_21080 [Pseudonocardiaceae bacterium]|nr:hypothetical protein [Pseudonocardiaceae bacterium]